MRTSSPWREETRWKSWPRGRTTTPCGLWAVLFNYSGSRSSPHQKSGAMLGDSVFPCVTGSRKAGGPSVVPITVPRPRMPPATRIWGRRSGWTGVRKIERSEVILPDDSQLLSQLTTRQAFPNSGGQFKLESKQQMRVRGLSSPDRADVVLGCLYKRTSRLFYAIIDHSED
jgi:hypothetical protein